MGFELLSSIATAVCIAGVVLVAMKSSRAEKQPKRPVSYAHLNHMADMGGATRSVYVLGSTVGRGNSAVGDAQVSGGAPSAASDAGSDGGGGD